MNLRFKIVLTAILACVPLGSAWAASNVKAPPIVVPTGLESVAVQLRAYLPDGAVSTLLARFAGLGGGQPGLGGVGVDGISLRVSVERELTAAVPGLSGKTRAALTDSILAGLAGARAAQPVPAVDPAAADAADPSTMLPPDLEREFGERCDAAVAEYAKLLRNGKANPSGEDVYELARSAAAGFGPGVRELAEALAVERIRSRTSAIRSDTDPAVDPAAADSSGNPR